MGLTPLLERLSPMRLRTGVLCAAPAAAAVHSAGGHGASRYLGGRVSA